jgi:transcriptional regulator with XRE-family HTH domain
MLEQYQNNDVLQEVVNGIKKLRKEKKVTLETFFFDTGIHIARIEQGKTNITVITLFKICIYFDITLLEFFEKYCSG